MLSIHVAVTKNVIKMNKSYCQTRLFMLYLNRKQTLVFLKNKCLKNEKCTCVQEKAGCDRGC